MDPNAREKKLGALHRIKELDSKVKEDLIKQIKNVKKTGKDDPRRIIHSMKVGLALTLVSSLYYVRPLYTSFGVSGMWAVLTVVVVFEFTVGGTLSKGLNRGFATLLAGALGVGSVKLARLFGDKGEPIVLGTLVFALGAAATFSRFFPGIKQRYDYGVLIFILTFSMVAVSGYRTNEILVLAIQRLSTILIGGALCMIVSIFVFPTWAGEDLHTLIANNIDKLGNYLEGFADEYLQTSEIVSRKDKSYLQGYKSVLTSKNNEENLANLARWEPGHGRFRLHHPWKEYLTVGALTRQCAYRTEILNGYVTSDLKAPQDFLRKIQEPCTAITTEAGKALKSLAMSIKTMTNDCYSKSHVQNSKNAIKDLRIALKSAAPETTTELLEIIPAATMITILIDVVKCVEKISVAVDDLSNKAQFKRIMEAPEKGQQMLHRGSVKPVADGDGDNHHHVVITVDDDETTANRDSPEKKIPDSSH